jgi:hypothetical protein
MKLKEIVKKAGKLHSDAAKAMFPNHNYAYQAYNRLSNINVLNEMHIQALSEFTGFSIEEIRDMRG